MTRAAWLLIAPLVAGGCTATQRYSSCVEQATRVTEGAKARSTSFRHMVARHCYSLVMGKCAPQTPGGRSKGGPAPAPSVEEATMARTCGEAPFELSCATENNKLVRGDGHVCEVRVELDCPLRPGGKEQVRLEAMFLASPDAPDPSGPGTIQLSAGGAPAMKLNVGKREASQRDLAVELPRSGKPNVHVGIDACPGDEKTCVLSGTLALLSDSATESQAKAPQE